MNDHRQLALELAHKEACQMSGNGISSSKIIESARVYEGFLTGSDDRKASAFSYKVAAARAAHEAIRTLQIENNEPNVASPWVTVGKDIRDSCYIGIDRVIENPDITNEELHNSWIVTKTEQGWKYGEVRSEEAKTHPCMVPYSDLPPFQRLKDAMFRNVVKAVLDL